MAFNLLREPLWQPRDLPIATATSFQLQGYDLRQPSQLLMSDQVPRVQDGGDTEMAEQQPDGDASQPAVKEESQGEPSISLGRLILTLSTPVWPWSSWLFGTLPAYKTCSTVVACASSFHKEQVTVMFDPSPACCLMPQVRMQATALQRSL